MDLLISECVKNLKGLRSPTYTYCGNCVFGCFAELFLLV